MYSLLFYVKPTSGDCKEALQRRTDKWGNGVVQAFEYI